MPVKTTPQRRRKSVSESDLKAKQQTSLAKPTSVKRTLIQKTVEVTQSQSFLLSIWKTFLSSPPKSSKKPRTKSTALAVAKKAAATSHRILSSLWVASEEEKEIEPEEDLTLWQRFYEIPRTVSMEPKFAHHPHIAEFYCTLTSPFFALASLLWFIPPPGIAVHEHPVRTVWPGTRAVQEILQMSGLDQWILSSLPQLASWLPLSTIEHPPTLSLPPLTHFCIGFSLLTAFASTVYHKTLYRVYSTADCAVATIMCYLVLAQIWSPFLREYYYENKLSTKWGLPPTLDFDTVWCSFILTGVVIPLAALFTWKWDRGSALLTVQTMSAVFPLIVWGLAQSRSWGALGSGVVGIVCFAMDRKRILPLHSFWHLFGGLFVWWSIWRSIEIEARVRQLYG